MSDYTIVVIDLERGKEHVSRNRITTLGQAEDMAQQAREMARPGTVFPWHAVQIRQGAKTVAQWLSWVHPDGPDDGWFPTDCAREEPTRLREDNKS